MGCWGIGGQWGPVAEDEAIRTMHAALELGVNLYDTADAYGQGVSEELVGKARRKWATSGGGPGCHSPTSRRSTSIFAAMPASDG